MGVGECSSLTGGVVAQSMKFAFAVSVGIPRKGGSAPSIRVQQGDWKEEWKLGEGVGGAVKTEGRLPGAGRRKRTYSERRAQDQAGFGGYLGPGDSRYGMGYVANIEVWGDS